MQGRTARRATLYSEGLLCRPTRNTAVIRPDRMADVEADMTGDGRGVLENVGGAFQVLWALLTPFLRGRRERWGARTAELQRSWPGDDLVPQPRWQYLHGITIDAATSVV